MTTRSMIGQMMVGSDRGYIIWGDVRGMVAEVDTYEQAEEELAADRDGCRNQGGYSDASIYQDDGNGHWEIVQ